ncbi:hypothetical protein [Marispirochaeta sp.]|uniref:hypothetical protein n=1 Tax=Marispirochaeta sp. TaxID=2038653 RepID=UPI0029C8916F|nr:hypothetical protein [Marispirochaeta sp.]
MNREFDRSNVRHFPLDERYSKIDIMESFVREGQFEDELTPDMAERLEKIADEIVHARERNAAVICAFGAHTIKNGMGKILGAFLRHGWFTHLATNGAGVIHDWEFAYHGKSSEDVRENVQVGKFGTWEETGLYINLALAVGAYEGLGYGASVGSLISRNGLDIPGEDELQSVISSPREELWRRAAAADLLDLLGELDIAAGFLAVAHPCAEYSVQAAAFDIGVPFTSHPMFGHDIIYTHRANKGAAVGRTAERDFLAYARSVSELEGGVYLSVGSAVMSPMIFEKSLSMARNVNAKKGRDIRNCGIHVIDLQPETWDWSMGEPPADNPAYYLRFMKTFNRMGCPVDYTSADNRVYLTGLYRALNKRSRHEG